MRLMDFEVGQVVWPHPENDRDAYWKGRDLQGASVGRVIRIESSFVRVKWDNGYEDGYPVQHKHWITPCPSYVEKCDILPV